MKGPRFIALWDNARLAVGTLAANPLRSLLTLLGVVIGVTTVVTMMALIEGLRTKVTSDLSNLGANVFTVSKWPGGFNLGRMDWRRCPAPSRTSGWRTSGRCASAVRR